MEDTVREMLIARMRRNGEPLDRAAETLLTVGVPAEVVRAAVAGIRREGAKNMLLDSPSGVYDHTTADEARLAGWYTGPEDGDEFWPRYRARLEAGPMRDVIGEVDEASTKVVAHLADPHVWNLKKRGLVVGYVQSGKTANYTAVMAKAADAGYRLFIVLAGMHNNLRRQTQVRLNKDLVDHDWAALTTNEEDFGNVINGAAMLSRGVNAIAVVKKNQARLRSLRDWLRDIPEEIRVRVPILILDDEADQATPNSATARDQLTRINELVRQIWAEVPTGTYVGYTATPFANVFMNPNDAEDLYPADFIIDLPRPEAYFGAERVFGREPLDDADDPDPGLDMIRDVPVEEADSLRPTGDASRRAEFDPELPPSLQDATVWFIVATAIRHARGQADEHSSMLVHTTHYVQPHFAMQDRLETLLDGLRKLSSATEFDLFREAFDRESARVAEVASLPLPKWEEVEAALPRVLERARVVVDNGYSLDRLDYESVDDKGNPIAEVVIAVGGGTLSRGLTLEGLAVSYFTRTSNTYDTLLQMGRWFGYRSGYEDLPRIWMQPELRDDFRFLALVEEEIRRDMRDMERMRVTPRELGVRVRAHPGRLSIVARNKMQHADVVRVSYSGTRLQTFILHEREREVLLANQRAAASFVRACLAHAGEPTKRDDAARWLFRDVPADLVLALLREYQFHPDQLTMSHQHMSAWIRSAAPDALWNVVVAGNDKVQRVNGEVIELGTLDLGIDSPVPAVNRSPLASEDAGRANIKALLSHNDWFADLDPDVYANLDDDLRRTPRVARREYAEGRGLLIIMPISKDSVPLRRSAQATSSRRQMNAPDHLVGLGLIFPDVERDGVADEGSYYSVRPDWEVVTEAEDELPPDREGSHVLDGDDVRASR